MTSPLLHRSALDQARLLDAREITSEELTELYLENIAHKNPALSAFVDVLADRALGEARAADRARRKGMKAPFLGIPTAVKDLNLVRGSFTRFGSRAFERFFMPLDDKTTVQLRLGGFVILGKTATSELGTMPVTEPDIHPPTRNPWDPSVTPGGSSGGAGSAVAAELVPLAQGSDGAGSVRIPASFCHLVGVKPSRGRLANAYSDDDDVIYTSGPLARTVDDAAAMLDVMAGISVGKPHVAPPPPAPFLELAQIAPKRLRIHVSLEAGAIVATHPDVKDAVLAVAKALEAMGHHVDERPMAEGTVDEFLPIWQHVSAEAPVHDWSLTQPVTRWLADKGRDITTAEVKRRTAILRARILAWFDDADVWLTPTVAIPPVAVGAWRHLSPEAQFAEACQLGVFTAPFNLSGQPAMSVPAGLTRSGLPIGAQLVGRPNAEATILAVAKQLEIAMPWSHRRPPEMDRT